MVSKNNSFQSNRTMQQQQQQQRQNVRASIAPYRKPFRPQMQGQVQAQNQLMFTSCQMPSDPLYVDFNRPAPAPPAAPPTKSTGPAVSSPTGNCLPGSDGGGKKKSLKSNKQLKGNKQQQTQQGQNSQYAPQMQMAMPMHGAGGDTGWQPHPQQRFHSPNANRFNGPQRNGFNRVGPPNRGGGVGIGRQMMGPMGPGPGPMGPRRGPGPGPNGGGPMPPFPPMPFQGPIPPMRCPMPPMGGPPPPPPFMRRNGRGAPNFPPLPPPLMGPHMMGPRMRPRGMPPGPSPFNMAHMNGNLNGHKIKKPNPKLIKQAVKGKSTIKTLKNLVNQYPIDKPWGQ